MSLDRYARTILVFVGETTGFAIDLRDPVLEEQRRVLAALASASEFAVLSACDPGGERSTPESNAERTRRLRAELERRGIRPVVDVVGRSPEGDRREPSVLAPVPLETAAELARAFGQEAFFWFDGEAFRVVGAEGREHGRLPRGPADRAD